MKLSKLSIPTVCVLSGVVFGIATGYAYAYLRTELQDPAIEQVQYFEKDAGKAVLSKLEIKEPFLAAPEQPKKVVIANCSAYTSSPDECGGKSDGITASGKKAVEGRTIAMDDVPLGTRVRIDGKEYVVEDRFGGDYENRIDIYVNSKEDAMKFGRQYKEVEILF